MEIQIQMEDHERPKYLFDCRAGQISSTAFRQREYGRVKEWKP